MAVSPDGTHLYVTNFSGNTVSVINTATNTVGAIAPAGRGAFGVAVGPDGSRVYVTDINSNTVSVINTGSNLITADHPCRSGPLRGGRRAQRQPGLCHQCQQQHGVCDQHRHQRRHRHHQCPATPSRGCGQPQWQPRLRPNAANDTVSVIDTATNTVTATIIVGSGPIFLAISPDGSRVYVANNGNNTVSVISTATNTTIGTPHSLSATAHKEWRSSPDGTHLYVANANSNSVLGDLPCPYRGHPGGRQSGSAERQLGQRSQ